jgi:hypothetical protein
MVERHSSRADVSVDRPPSLKDLLSDDMREIRMRIVSLFHEKKTSLEIARAMNGELSGSMRADETVASLIRKLIVRVVPETERREHESEMHRKRAKNNHASQNAARDEALRKRGMKVWTAEESDYFVSLVIDDSYVREEDRQTKKRQRRKHMNHVALSKAMNERFATTEFTPEKTAARLDYLRAQAKLRANASVDNKKRAPDQDAR